MNDTEFGEMVRPFWNLWAASYEISAMYCLATARFWGAWGQYYGEKAAYLNEYQRRWDLGDRSMPMIGKW